MVFSHNALFPSPTHSGDTRTARPARSTTALGPSNSTGDFAISSILHVSSPPPPPSSTTLSSCRLGKPPAPPPHPFPHVLFFPLPPRMDVKIVVQPRGGFVLDALDDDRLGQSDVAALAPPNESVDHFPFPLFLFCVYNI